MRLVSVSLLNPSQNVLQTLDILPKEMYGVMPVEIPKKLTVFSEARVVEHYAIKSKDL